MTGIIRDRDLSVFNSSYLDAEIEVNADYSGQKNLAPPAKKSLNSSDPEKLLSVVPGIAFLLVYNANGPGRRHEGISAEASWTAKSRKMLISSS